METDDPTVRILRPRFSMRQWMLLPVIFAVLAALWVQVDRYRWSSHTRFVQSQMEWSQRHVDTFKRPPEIEWRQGHLVTVDRPVVRTREKPARDYLLKLCVVTNADREGIYYFRQLELGQDGWFHSLRHVPYAVQGSGTQISLEKMSLIKQILPKLPPSRPISRQSEYLLVSFHEQGKWVTKAFEIAALPREVEDLLAEVQFRMR